MAERHAIDDDLVIFGDMAGKEQYVKMRASSGKHFFRYSERLLKRGDWWRFIPQKSYRTWNMFTRYRKCKMNVLCAGAFTARDLSLSGFPLDKCLKWGYFPEVDINNGRKWNYSGKDINICSAQRLIPWKRVDLQLDIAKLLKRNGVNFKLWIVGAGVEESKLKRLSQSYGLDDCVKFCGELCHEETIKVMKNSDIFLATSNRMEGWGATINEAMAAGCCVVANGEIGSVPYLVRDGQNGYVVQSCNAFSFYELIDHLIENPAKIEIAGREAMQTIAFEWNAETASRRLMSFYYSEVCQNSRHSFDWPTSGPLSLC